MWPVWETLPQDTKECILDSYTKGLRERLEARKEVEEKRGRVVRQLEAVFLSVLDAAEEGILAVEEDVGDEEPYLDEFRGEFLLEAANLLQAIRALTRG